ncbi:hypothetical protein ACIRD3_40095, partial [Kitasatospora sp. NPDC093550]|uniref:hypothetical protein n=1 Tax=Kitasatospora sp. NPDC093550 TaxID=3364089 RepID=UPI003809C5F1
PSLSYSGAKRQNRLSISFWIAKQSRARMERSGILVALTECTDKDFRARSEFGRIPLEFHPRRFSGNSAEFGNFLFLAAARFWLLSVTILGVLAQWCYTPVS